MHPGYAPASGHSLVAAEGDVGGATDLFGLQHPWSQPRAGIQADPQFRDPAKDDYTLLPDSPAHELGFQPLDLSTVGPRLAAGHD